MNGDGDGQPRAKITLAVEIRGDWVTPEVIAETARALSATAELMLGKFRGEAADPGEIHIRLDVPPNPAPPGWQPAEWPHP